MNPIETNQATTPESIVDADPLPTTEDRLLDYLDHIRRLWDRHAHTLQESNQSEHDAAKADLLEAYQVIFALEDFLKDNTTELLLQPATLEAARFELWFAGHHLHKVIK